MNVMDVNLPELTGNMGQDITNLHNYCDELRRTLEFMLLNLNSRNFNLNLLPELFKNSGIEFKNGEIRQLTGGIWIGTKIRSDKTYTPADGDYGIYISYDSEAKIIVNGEEKALGGDNGGQG